METRGISFKAACVALTLALAGLAVADEWGPPKKEHWSADRAYVLRVNDSAKTLSLKHDSGNGFAVDWSIKYPQQIRPNYPYAPNIAYVSDSGKHVVLCNVHASLGYGKVLVFLGAKGEILKSYELDEFLTEEEVLYASHTISSIHWAEYDLHFLDEVLGHFQIITRAGTLVVFDLKTGRIVEATPELSELVNGKGMSKAQEFLESDDKYDKLRGARLALQFGNTDFVPEIIPLLNDRSSGHPHDWEGTRHTCYSVQTSAGYVLSEALGAKAAHLFEAKLKDPNDELTLHWLGFMGEIGAAASSEIVLALTKDERAPIAEYATLAILKTDDGTALRQNLDWFTHKEYDVRFRAVKFLPIFGDSRDYEYLKRALWDKDSSVSIWALRGLIKLDPAELDSDLKEVAEGGNHNWNEYAVIELAKRGDLIYQARLVEWIKLLAGDEEARKESPLHLSAALDSMKVLAETKPDGAVEALRALSVSEAMNGMYTGTSLKIGVLGTLAAMGHKDVLPELRKLAIEGDALDKSRAIEWLGFCKDAGFITELTAMLDDREPWIREAAAKALAAIGADSIDNLETATRVDSTESPRPSPLALLLLVLFSLGTCSRRLSLG